jgi:hypothetical protein
VLTLDKKRWGFKKKKEGFHIESRPFIKIVGKFVVAPVFLMMVSGKSYPSVRVQLSTFALLIYAANVVSYKDNKSYGTYSNPNTAYSHYWADASNVLDDLTTFRKLYVQYYGCA